MKILKEAIKKSPEVKVIALPCPQCSGQIEGSGKCPNCGQFLLIMEDGNYLSINPQDYAGIEIHWPKDTSDTAQVTFDYSSKLKDLEFTREDLFIIGKGSVEFGAQIVALWFKQNFENYGLPGQQLPKIQSMRDFALRAALKQAALRNSR